MIYLDISSLYRPSPSSNTCTATATTNRYSVRGHLHKNKHIKNSRNFAKKFRKKAHKQRVNYRLVGEWFGRTDQSESFESGQTNYTQEAKPIISWFEIVFYILTSVWVQLWLIRYLGTVLYCQQARNISQNSERNS